MTARTVELTADQLDAIGRFRMESDLWALAADSDHPRRPHATGRCFPATTNSTACHLEWRGRHGITGTVHDREVRVTDADLIAWARAIPQSYRFVASDVGGLTSNRVSGPRVVQLFTQTRCAAPADFAPEPMSGPQSARMLHVCAVPAIYRDEQVRTLISHAGVPQYGFDFPYPCRWCKRVGYHESMADRPEVDALVGRLRELGVLVSDQRAEPADPEYAEDGGLFDLPDGYVDEHAAPELSRGEKRARTVENRILAGQHPLGYSGRYLPLHPDAPRTADRTAPGPRCGTCAHREIQSHHNKTYPKCMFGEGIRVTGCESSDVRAWWPACRDYEKDGTL